jgi:perosamine synthetase
MNEGADFLPWSRPRFWGREEDYVLAALRSTWISGGPFVEQLESQVASYLGRKHALAVANGTAAIHLAYLAMGLRDGDEVVVPGFGFLAAANVALHFGATPVFCDVDPATWCMRASDIEKVLTPRTRAIVAVHNYGNMCEMGDLLALAARAGVPVIEDAAEALGSKLGQKPAGAFGEFSTFSFHATKTITTGEGGLIATDDDRAADKLRLFRSHGLRRHRHYWHEVPGHNFRLTNLQAALGLAQFEHIEQIVAERQRVVEEYRRRLEPMGGVELQAITAGCEPLIWAVAVRLSPEAFPQGRDAVMAALAARKIETRPGFQAPGEMEYFGRAELPVAEELGRWVLSLPTYPMLDVAQTERVCAELEALRAS